MLNIVEAVLTWGTNHGTVVHIYAIFNLNHIYFVPCGR